MSNAEDQQFSADPRLGDLLREAREERGLELSDVAGLTNVRRDYLEALEEGRYSDLPEDVYTRNFLKLFAQAVGLDAVRAQEMYRSERREGQGLDTTELRLERDREIASTVPAGDGNRWWESPRSGPRWGPLISTVLMVLAVVAFALWGFNSTFFDASRETPAETPGESQPEGAPAQSTAAEAETEAAAAEEETFPRTVRLSVESTPPGAEVLVDEFPLPGVTPIESAPVTARPSRTIRVVREGYLPYEEEFDLTRDRNLSFFLTPVTAEEQPTASEGNETATTVETDGATETAGQEGEVVLTITEDTWLEVYSGTNRNQGDRLAFTTARAGQAFSYPLPVYIHVGNAGGVELTVEGEDRGVLGSSGEVLGLAVTN